MDVSKVSRRVHSQLFLPPLRSGNGAGDSFGTHLNRQKGWLAMRDQMALQQRRLVPYSFRHTYSLRGTAGASTPERWPTAWGIPWRCNSGATPGLQRATQLPHLLGRRGKLKGNEGRLQPSSRGLCPNCLAAT